MLALAVAIALCVAGCNLCVGFEFSKDGSIEQLKFAQQAVVRNENDASLIASKFPTSTAILSICKNKQQARSILGTVHSRNDNLYENKHLRALFVGKRSDCQQARLLCSELDLKHNQANGESLTASKMALRLADIAQQRSVSLNAERMLAYNALILNTDQASGSFGDIYKVDVSGNFFRCEGTCIGARSDQVKSWLEKQKLQNSLSSGPDKPASGCLPSVDEITDTTESEVFNNLAQCLRDNYTADDLAVGNFSVSITVLQKRPDGERVVLGPYQVPEEVLRRLVPHPPGASTSDADTISTGLVDPPVNSAELIEPVEPAEPATVLHSWWKTLNSVSDIKNNLGSRHARDVESPVWMRHS